MVLSPSNGDEGDTRFDRDSKSYLRNYLREEDENRGMVDKSCIIGLTRTILHSVWYLQETSSGRFLRGTVGCIFGL